MLIPLYEIIVRFASDTQHHEPPQPANKNNNFLQQPTSGDTNLKNQEGK